MISPCWTYSKECCAGEPRQISPQWNDDLQDRLHIFNANRAKPILCRRVQGWNTTRTTLPTSAPTPKRASVSLSETFPNNISLKLFTNPRVFLGFFNQIPLGLEICGFHSVQGVTKRCRLSWLTNRALVYEPKCGGGGWLQGFCQWVQLCTWSPNKLWRSNSTLKGTVSRDFLLLVFSWISFPKLLIIPFGPFLIFSKIRGDIRSSRFATGVNDTGGKWKKPSSWKILIILFGHLWVVELTYVYIFAFKFTLRCLQPDIVASICHRCHRHRWQICRRCCWYRWQFATGVVDTSGKFAAGTVDTGGKFATGINNASENGGKISHLCR